MIILVYLNYNQIIFSKQTLDSIPHISSTVLCCKNDRLFNGKLYIVLTGTAHKQPNDRITHILYKSISLGILGTDG
jgi:hypothetical protein